MSDNVRLDALREATRTDQLIDPKLSRALTDLIQGWLNGNLYTFMCSGDNLSELCDQLMCTLFSVLTDGDREKEWAAVRDKVTWQITLLSYREHSSIMGCTMWNNSGSLCIFFDSEFLHELDVLHSTKYTAIAAAMFVTVLLHEVAHCFTTGDGVEEGKHTALYWYEAKVLFRHTPIHADACTAAATLFFQSNYVGRLLNYTTADSVSKLIDACCM